MSNHYLFRLQFKLRIHEAQGEPFQALFGRLMSHVAPGFQPIKPTGSLGDGGNDGWIPDQGHYFQVYAPAATTKPSPTEAVSKAIDDFGKLRSNWTGIKRYSFVMNDRFTGIPSEVAKALQVLAGSEKIVAGALSTQELMTKFNALGDDDKGDVVETFPPPMDVVEVVPGAVGEVLRAIADSGDCELSLALDAPDFDEKLKMNGLADILASELRHASYHIGTVDAFLDKDPGLAQDVAQQVRAKYLNSKERFAGSDHDLPNVRYLWLREQLMPKARLHRHSQLAYVHAVRLVMAKYFESCDIYEHPSAS